MTKIIPITKPIDVSVVIPTYNKVHLTAQVFTSLARTMGDLTYEIIVVDNGSTDETLSFVGSHSPGQIRGKAQGESTPRWVKLLHNETPRLLAKSWNMGVDAAIGKHILITNNDVIFAPGSVQAMMWAADCNSMSGIVVPMGPRDIPNAPFISRPDIADAHIATILGNIEEVENFGNARTKNGRITFLPDPQLPQGGYCFLLTRRAWDKVGRFDEEYDLTGEDWDYFSRLRRYYKLCRAHDAYVEHHEHSSCKDLGQEWHERLCRNRFRLTEKVEGCQEIFSIIMPVYNRTDSLKLAIDSVLAQTFPHWRLYIIDDGSNQWDQIQQISKAYAVAANRIWFFHRPRNEGPAAARNYGMSLGRGKYIAFLDSDDIWYPNHLASHFEVHENDNPVMVYSDPEFAWRWWDAKIGRYLHQVDAHPLIDYFGDWNPALLKQKNYIQTSGVSVWADLAKTIQFPENMRLGEDWEFCKAIGDVGGAGRHVQHLARKTCRYHHSRDPHEEDHLVRGVIGRLLPSDIKPPRVIIKAETSGPIGVVIPVFNRSESLANAIQSCFNEPVVVVDDGSSNAGDIYDIVRSFPYASLLRTDSNHGASVARNAGIRHLNTEWIQFLDDDDILLDGWEMRLLSAGQDADVVIASALVPDGDHRLVVDTNIFTSQICVKRSAVLDAGGFKPGVSWAEERELIDRMQASGMRIVRVPLPTVVRPSRGGSGDPATAVARNKQPGIVHRTFGGRF